MTEFSRNPHPDDDILDEAAIRVWLDPALGDGMIKVFPVLDSTNNYAKELPAAPHHSVIVAESQTAGRGRRGHSFFSPARTGLYMSIIVRPDRAAPGDCQLFTIAAAVAVCRAVEKILPSVQPRIKWVNDILVAGRKVAGILAEAGGNFVNGIPENLIVGIGVNLSTADFPAEIRELAAALTTPENDEKIRRAELAAEIMNAFFALTDKNMTTDSAARRKELLEEYRARSLVLGQTITYSERGRTRTATVLAINDLGNLVVRRADGEEVLLNSGEISIKL